MNETSGASGQGPVHAAGAAPGKPRARVSWADFFAFRVMVTPALIRIVYMIGVALITLGAVLTFLSVPVTTCVGTNDSVTCTGGGPAAVVYAVLIAVVVFTVGQLSWRVITELLYVIFGIHESVRNIERRDPAT